MCAFFVSYNMLDEDVFLLGIHLDGQFAHVELV
jgi:hypothetical protein